MLTKRIILFFFGTEEFGEVIFLALQILGFFLVVLAFRFADSGKKGLTFSEAVQTLLNFIKIFSLPFLGFECFDDFWRFLSACSLSHMIRVFGELLLALFVLFLPLCFLFFLFIVLFRLLTYHVQYFSV